MMASMTKPTSENQRSAGHRLSDWLYEKRMAVDDFVVKYDFNQSEVYMYMSGRRNPTLAKAVKIEDITKGAIKARDWV